MRLHSTIALAAVAAVIGAPAVAEAKTKAKHHPVRAAGASTAAELARAQAQINELQARLSSLEAKIDQSGGSSQTAVAAQTQAAAASQQAADASAKADQALAEASTASTKAEKANKGLDLVKWAGDTQVHGQVFFNASSNSQHTAGGPVSTSGTGFNIKRVYLSVDHTFSPIFSADITTDIANVVGSTAFNANTATANTTASTAQTTVGKGVFIKYAYVQAKLDPAFTVRLGSAPMPWIPYVEANYGHRYVENEVIDEYKNYGTTADWGVHVLGSLANGLISYQVSAVDGGTFRHVYVTKAIDVEGRLSAQYKGFWAAIGGYTGKLANDIEQTTAQAAAGIPTTLHTARRGDAALGYNNKLFSLGGEYFYAKDWLSVATPATVTTAAAIPAASLAQDSAKGFSVFGNVNFAPKWSVFGRYDWVREIAKLGSGNSAVSHYFNAGIQWEPVKILDLSLVYKRDSILDEGVASIATQNGTIGGTTLGTRGTYDEFGLWGQIKF